MSEQLWRGDFGNDYIDRNQVDNKLFWMKVLSFIPMNSFFEFGANTGMNIKALKSLYKEAEFGAMEINEKAYEKLSKICDNAILGSIFNYKPDKQYEFVFTKGLLIHIQPERLDEAYGVLYNTSSKYIMIAEYYNPTPVMVRYRGHENELWKRDFAGDMMDKYKLKLKDYGFIYHRDVFNQDDITYFILEK